jgi:hypothetical protein
MVLYNVIIIIAIGIVVSVIGTIIGYAVGAAKSNENEKYMSVKTINPDELKGKLIILKTTMKIEECDHIFKAFTNCGVKQILVIPPDLNMYRI